MSDAAALPLLVVADVGATLLIATPLWIALAAPAAWIALYLTIGAAGRKPGG